MQRKFLLNLFFLLGLNLLIKPFWIFGIDVTVQNVVGEQVYGLYFTLFNFSIIFNTILDFGINNFNNKNVAANPEFLQKNFSSMFSLKILLGFVYFIVIFVAGLIAGYRKIALELLLMIAFNQFLSYFILYLRSNISGLLMFKTDSIISVIDRLIMIVCCGILLWGNVTKKTFQIEWFIYCQTFAYLVTIAIALPIVLKHVKLQFPTWNPNLLKKILWQSFPFALLALLTGFHNRIDAVLLERLLPGTLGDAQSGIYASAFRFLDAATMIAYLFSVILLPLFSNILQKKENVFFILKTAFSLMFVYGFLLAIFSWFFAFPIMNLLYKHHVEASFFVFRLLMISILPLSSTYIFGTLLTAMGELKKLNIIALIAVIVNISLNLYLIPHYQACGSAFASLCTQIFLASAEVYFVKKICKISISIKYILQLFIFSLFSVAIVYASSQLNINWKYSCILAAIATFLVAFATNLFSPRKIFSLIKNEK